MGKGRLPLPREVRILRGTYRADRELPGDPPHPGGKLCCPAWLSPGARREWRRIIAGAPAGMLTGFDQALLAVYCWAYDRFRQAVEEEDISEARKSSELLNRLASPLGMSPAARTRIRTGHEEVDDFDKFTSGAAKASA